MSTTDGPSAQYKAAATTLALLEFLRAKKKGDRITAQEIVTATGDANWHKYRTRIVRWSKDAGFVVEAIVNDGYRVMLDHEHSDHAIRQKKSSARKNREAMRAVQSVDVTKVDAKEQRRLEFVGPRIALSVMNDERDLREIKKEFKLTERNPLRIASAKLDESD